jgi:hypothetical protein
MWDPATDGDQYLRELFRFDRIAHLTDGASAAVDPRTAIADEGSADLSGFTVHRAFAASVSGHSLVGELGVRPRPILLVQVHIQPRLKPEYAAMVAPWLSTGFDVDVETAQGQEAWWFPGLRWQESPAAERRDRIRSTTVGWFETRFTEMRADG